MQREKWIYDIETYPNTFTFSVVREDSYFHQTLEVSPFKNEIERIFKCLDYLHDGNHWMVGFNNTGFDYPVLHELIKIRDSLPVRGETIARKVYKFAMQQIASTKEQFPKTIPFDEQYVKQIDLFKIWHFDNKAKATNLKMLEVNMLSESVEDLPFDVGTELTQEQIEVLKKYNSHDVTETLKFFQKSKEQVDFREVLSKEYDRDFMNHNDTKIGKDYFIMELEKSKIPVYKYVNGKRTMNQSVRNKIKIGECLFDYYKFNSAEFNAVKDWFSNQVISETKGVFSEIEEHTLGEVAKFACMEVKKKKFKGKPSLEDELEFQKEHPCGWIEIEELKALENLIVDGEQVMEYPLDEFGQPDTTQKMKKKTVPKKSYWGCWKEAATLNVNYKGFQFDFGTGGIHGSIESQVVEAEEGYIIKDADVTSLYPNIAIRNRVYPEHLTDKFCDIYSDLFDQRQREPKGTSKNAMLKLALNGVYGDSNNQYSPFFDPKYTMTITINGQLSLCMLAERLLDQIEGITIIQINTDGVTVKIPKDKLELYNSICKEWEAITKLTLEFVDYSKMIIRDVNNYIAVYTNGKVKRKGAYQYEGLGWHQNQGGLVIPMAAEASMLKGIPVEEFVKNHKNKWDFMLRTKVPRSSKLFLFYDNGDKVQQQNICRYYPCESGGKLVKMMPSLDGSDEMRELSLDKDWNVKICNKATEFDFSDVNYEYYVQEAKKLIIE